MLVFILNSGHVTELVSGREEKEIYNARFDTAFIERKIKILAHSKGLLLLMKK